VRLLSYNIRHGGSGREEAIAAVIRAEEPDLVVLQEARRPDAVNRIADLAGLTQYGARAGESLAFIAREPVRHAAWHKPRVSRHAFLEVVPARGEWRVFGVHLSAVHAAWTEQRRVFELRALLAAVAQHQHGAHALIGDFNTLAPGELLDIRKLPGRLRALVWLSGGRIRWRTIQTILDARYRDAFRHLHPDLVGSTFPTWDPHIRLDYLFVPDVHLQRIAHCRVVDSAIVRTASDHLPLCAELVDGSREG
jgi:endonuclease/exonuclease/phosphatase family metal-dependent hydrolase